MAFLYSIFRPILLFSKLEITFFNLFLSFYFKESQFFSFNGLFFRFFTIILFKNLYEFLNEYALVLSFVFKSNYLFNLFGTVFDERIASDVYVYFEAFVAFCHYMVNAFLHCFTYFSEIVAKVIEA